MTGSSGNEKRREGEPDVRGVSSDPRPAESDSGIEPRPTLSEEELGRLVEFFRILDRWDREFASREAGKKVA